MYFLSQFPSVFLCSSSYWCSIMFEFLELNIFGLTRLNTDFRREQTIISISLSENPKVYCNFFVDTFHEYYNKVSKFKFMQLNLLSLCEVIDSPKLNSCVQKCFVCMAIIFLSSSIPF